jgi:LacI family transcriptional regulator
MRRVAANRGARSLARDDAAGVSNASRRGRRNLAISKPGRRQRGVPTISDVARRAGVSPMTVSRVVNGESNVRRETRELVNAAIGELNYAPNQAARSLAGAAQIRVGLLYANPSAGFLGELLMGSLDEATRRNVQLVFERCDTGEEEVAVARRLVDDGVDGVMLTPPLCEMQPVLDVFAGADIPTVLIAAGRGRGRELSVAIDNRRAAHEMTAHLLSLGHRRIGFVIGDPNQSASGHRLQGYRDALVEAGLPHDEALIAPGLFTYRSGLDAAERLLRLAVPPSAVFASNDDMAAATVAVAHRHGLDVPGDLTVVGFDDTTLATAIWPELTTIRQPIADMSRRAVAMLVDAIRGQVATDADEGMGVVDFALIRRQSDAAPRRLPPAGSA